MYIVQCTQMARDKKKPTRSRAHSSKWVWQCAAFNANAKCPALTKRIRRHCVDSVDTEDIIFIGNLFSIHYRYKHTHTAKWFASGICWTYFFFSKFHRACCVGMMERKVCSRLVASRQHRTANGKLSLIMWFVWSMNGYLQNNQERCR